MLFSVYALDVSGSSTLRAEHGAGHRERLQNHDHPVKVIMAGPLLDGDGAPAGSLLIIDANTVDDVRAFVDADPYSLNGVYESVDIRPMRWTIGGETKGAGAADVTRQAN